MLSQNITRLVKNIVRTLKTSSAAFANHYETLGITPRCTQSDIKSAYYKLSKLYHPDISSDEESAKKFRAISEAYEVLGNVKLKKMYDKGLLTRERPRGSTEYRPEPEPTDPTLKFYKSRSSRHITPTMDGKIPIYDFDAWFKNHYGDIFRKSQDEKESKNHYGDIFRKSQDEKELLRKKRDKQSDAVNSNRQEATIYVIFIITGLFFALVLQGKTEYDIDRTPRTDIQAQPSSEDKTVSS